MEFYSDSCVVKDKQTQEVLLRGKLRDGLYQIEHPNNQAKRSSYQVSIYPNESSFSTFVAKSKVSDVPRSARESESTFKLWHMRFGHLTNHVMSQVLKS